MSMKAMHWAVDQQGVQGASKAVLLVLAYRFNDQQSGAWPSIGKIAADAGLGKRTVIRALDTLEEKGLIVKQRRPGNGKGRQCNLYGLPGYVKTEARCHTGTLPVGGKVPICDGQSAKLTQARCQSGTRIKRNPKKNPKSNSNSSSRATRRCPESFYLDEVLRSWLVDEGFDINLAERELAKFRDHEFRSPKSDWPATFRNWIRKAAEMRVGARAGDRRLNYTEQLHADRERLSADSLFAIDDQRNVEC